MTKITILITMGIEREIEIGIKGILSVIRIETGGDDPVLIGSLLTNYTVSTLM